jgi:membrane protein YqaA with SNARE-associated domain
MEMSPSVMYVLLPIIGLVIGAALNYLFTKFLEERRHRRNLKTQAYVDFSHNFMDAFL